ncbi:hypothetical protein [Micromonospora sp. WMMD1082]|nr:hypothetical protein [Micromonospora sp. WMMD1082]MDG4795087.1 hypothetical protein [Micromonospora sp. WMMD1082]
MTIDTAWLRHRYLQERIPVETIAAEAGVTPSAGRLGEPGCPARSG